MKDFIPTLPELGRETIIVICGALFAALLIRLLPKNLQAYFYIPGQGKPAMNRRLPPRNAKGRFRRRKG